MNAAYEGQEVEEKSGFKKIILDFYLICLKLSQIDFQQKQEQNKIRILIENFQKREKVIKDIYQALEIFLDSTEEITVVYGSLKYGLESNVD